MVLFVDVFLSYRLLAGVASAAILVSFHVWIQILQIDLVVVLILKSMQAAVWSLLKEELAQVRGRDEVVSLRVEGVRATTLIWAVPLTLVQTGLTVGATAFFTNTQRAAFGTIDTLIVNIDGFFTNLAAMDVYFISNY